MAQANWISHVLVQYFFNYSKMKFLDLAPKLAPEAKSSSLREAGTRLAFVVALLQNCCLLTFFGQNNSPAYCAGHLNRLWRHKSTDITGWEEAEIHTPSWPRPLDYLAWYTSKIRFLLSFLFVDRFDWLRAMRVRISIYLPKSRNDFFSIHFGKFSSRSIRYILTISMSSNILGV